MYVIMEDEGKNLISHAGFWFSTYHTFLLNHSILSESLLCSITDSS